ncbi:MAG: hypothetical protein JRI32_06020 [Deltaproteobacteria bacterium]|nr:hypothetical protein [Deltaproteobacteria bacterium]
MKIWQEKDPCNTILMVTFTTPHHQDQSLSEVLQIQDKTIRRMKNQKQSSRKTYKVYQTIMDEIGFVGSVTGRDTTFGQNGWHPHRHEAYFTVKATLEDLKKVRINLTVAFAKSFVKCGGTINDLGVFFKRAVVIDQVNEKDFHRVSGYITKVDHAHWTVAKEVTKGLSKTAKNGNITPFGMLAVIRSGHEQSGLYSFKFMEFAMTMKGKRSIFYSKGLKLFLGTHWKTDEEIMQENDSMSDLYAILENGDFQQIVDQELLGEVLTWTENRSPSEFYEAFKAHLLEKNLQKTA